jgi:hypothetical protein
LHFNVNYGQYFTYADKLGGSFRAPVKGQDPLLIILEREKRQLDGLASGNASDEDSLSGSEGSSDSGFEETVAGEKIKAE